jgi:hypothetical protein
MRNQKFSVNEINESLFKEFEQKHLDGGGGAPKETAITNLVRESIKNKSYRTYNGGGFYDNGDIVNKYDVVVWFTWSGDPEFMVCFDHDLDFCDLYGCNKDGKLTFIAK